MSRGALITLLLVVAALLVPFALVGLWTHQVLLDRERFTNLSDDLLDRSAVRRGLADETVAQLERARPGLRAGEPALVVIARRSEVPVQWGAVDAAKRIAFLTPLVVLGLLALAVAMARRRWLTLGIVGSVVAGVSLLLLGLMALAKQVVGRRLDAVVSRDAFDAAWEVIARSLTNTTLIIVLGALVVAAGGFVVHLILTRRPSPAH